MPEDQAPKLKTVGRYQIIEELGRGAMAVVYKGKDPVIGRTVALKTLLFRDDNKEMRDLRQALYRDACAAGTLAHPNIVTIYDVIEEAGMTAVAMEFIEGRTLDAIIKEKAPLPIDMTLGLFDQIVAGLDYAHTKGIIHRDVKPANIMLTNDGRVKVTDFGVARVTSAGATMTATVVGSPSYMSPEQIRGGKLDGRSDLFSAATVAYEMLTKERPFPGDDIATTLYRIVHELPTPITEFNPAIGPELTRVFERAMAKDPNERYPTGVELAKAMRQAAEATGKSTARVTAADIAATVKIRAAVAPVAAAAPAAAKVERAAAVVPAAVEAPSRGKPTALIAAGVAAVLVLGVGGYLLFGNRGTEPSVGQTGSVTSAPPPASAQTPSVPASGAPVTQPPPVTTATEPPAPASTITETAPPPARQTNVAAARRGGPANANASPTPPAAARSTRGSQTTTAPAQQQPTAAVGAPAGGTAAPPPAVTAPPVETPAARPTPPPVETPPVRTEPPAPAPAATTINIQFEVLADENTTGLQVLIDGRVVSGLYPPTQRVTAGTHEVTYRWTQGSLAGQEFTRSVDIPSTATLGVRVRANPATRQITTIIRR